MAQVKKSENVPKSMQEKYQAIVEITDSFSRENLNDEYAQLIRYAVAAVCRKRPSPIETGKANTWACGVTHAIGMVNFLFDKSQTPYISAKELYKKFGIGEVLEMQNQKPFVHYWGCISWIQIGHYQAG